MGCRPEDFTDHTVVQEEASVHHDYHEERRKKSLGTMGATPIISFKVHWDLQLEFTRRSLDLTSELWSRITALPGSGLNPAANFAFVSGTPNTLWAKKTEEKPVPGLILLTVDRWTPYWSQVPLDQPMGKAVREVSKELSLSDMWTIYSYITISKCLRLRCKNTKKNSSNKP